MFNFLKRIFKGCDDFQEKKSAFYGGRLARINGCPVTDNPHKIGTQVQKWWGGGWSAVNNRLKKEK